MGICLYIIPAVLQQVHSFEAPVLEVLVLHMQLHSRAAAGSICALSSKVRAPLCWSHCCSRSVWAIASVPQQLGQSLGFLYAERAHRCRIARWGEVKSETHRRACTSYARVRSGRKVALHLRLSLAGHLLPCGYAELHFAAPTRH